MGKAWGMALIASLLAGLTGVSADAETPNVSRPPEVMPVEASQPSTIGKCSKERALQDTLYWAVEVYDRCVAVQNENCTVPDFVGYPHPSRARMVQLRNQAKSDLDRCLNE